MHVLLIAVVVSLAFNSVFCYMIYKTQQAEAHAGKIPARRSIIPGTRQQFLYLQDFRVMVWGDWICLAVTGIAFWYLVLSQNITPLSWVAYIAIAIIDAIAFTLMCLVKTHKPDYGFPEVGKTSIAGYLHSGYHGCNVAGIILSVWHFLIGNLHGWPMWCLFIGGGAYLVAFYLDIRTGNFAKVEYIQKPQGGM